MFHDLFEIFDYEKQGTAPTQEIVAVLKSFSIPRAFLPGG